jgi:hypothetical protein
LRYLKQSKVRLYLFIKSNNFIYVPLGKTQWIRISRQQACQCSRLIHEADREKLLP